MKKTFKIQNIYCVDISPRTEVIAIFVRFSLFRQNLVVMATSPNISLCRNVLVKLAILENSLYKWSPCGYLWYKSSYSCFSPKVGRHGNVPLSFAHGSILVEFADSRNPISEPNSMSCRSLSRLELKLSPFCVISLLFRQIWLPWQRTLVSRCQRCNFIIAWPLFVYSLCYM